MHLCPDEFNALLAAVPFVGQWLAATRSAAKHLWCKITGHRKHKTPALPLNDRCDKCFERFHNEGEHRWDFHYGWCDACIANIEDPNETP